jgi:alpha-beta hydrolase superfamily lysophospholipase
MKTECTTFTFKDADGVVIFVRKWLPNGKPKAVVQISHGMQEHGGRYEPFAELLTAGGYAVYASDQRGHGKTALGMDKQGQLGPGGWDHTVAALRQLTESIRKDFPGVPVFLCGHSWGSLLAQNYLQRWGGELQGAILCGTTGKNPMVRIGRWLARRRVRRQGAAAPGGILEKMSFAGYNRKFAPIRTPKDWLSRDNEEVDKYIADPYCGKPFPNGFFFDLADLLVHTWEPQNERRVPKGLPIRLMSGALDPVGMSTKAVTALARRYEKNGIRDITCRFYPGARHELLHETNRAEVMQEVLAWLDSHLD